MSVDGSTMKPLKVVTFCIYNFTVVFSHFIFIFIIIDIMEYRNRITLIWLQYRKIVCELNPK